MLDDLDLDRLIRNPPQSNLIQIISTIILLILFITFSVLSVSGFKKIETDIRENTTIIHDTVTIIKEAPRSYNCWTCGKSFEIEGNQIQRCCNLEYKLINKELTARKIQ